MATSGSSGAGEATRASWTIVLESIIENVCGSAERSLRDSETIPRATCTDFCKTEKINVEIFQPVRIVICVGEDEVFLL